MLTQTEWDALDWKSRIKHAMHAAGCKHTPAFAQYMGIPLLTIRNWLKGKNTPRAVTAEKIQALVVEPNDAASSRWQDHAHHAMAVQSMDASKEWFTRVLRDGNKSLLSMAVHSLAIKFANIFLAYVDAAWNYSLTYQGSLDVFPAAETVQLSYVPSGSMQNYATITFSHPATDPVAFTIKLVIYKKGQLFSHFATTASDKALLQITKRLHRHLTN